MHSHPTTDQSRALDIRYGPKTQTDGKLFMNIYSYVKIPYLYANNLCSEEEIRALVGGIVLGDVCPADSRFLIVLQLELHPDGHQPHHV